MITNEELALGKRLSVEAAIAHGAVLKQLLHIFTGAMEADDNILAVTTMSVMSQMIDAFCDPFATLAAIECEFKGNDLETEVTKAMEKIEGMLAGK